jgi:transposase
MQIRSVGIDLGKTTFHLVALGDNGKVLLKKKLTQKQLITFTANLTTSLIGMEACSGAHFLGRVLRAQVGDARALLECSRVMKITAAAARNSPHGTWTQGDAL